MELLKTIPFNFRYYIFTSTSKEILVVYYKSECTIDDNTPTLLETSYLPIFRKQYNIDESQTIKITCKDDELQIDDLNNRIIDYCNKRQNYNEFKIYSASPEYKIMFEERTTKAIFQSCKKAYFELGAGGVFRTGKTDYGQLSKIDIKSGTWFIDGESTIYVDEFNATDLKIDVYNREKKSSVLNLVVKTSFKGIRLMIYSTIQMVVLNSSKSQEQFLQGKISFAYINIFGEEIFDDNDQPRIEFRGFEKVGIGCIEVANEVKYGNILYVDNLTKFNLMRIKRRISQIDKGSFIQIDRVGTVNLTDIQYTFADDSMLVDGAAIVTFLHSETELERVLNIYNTNIVNNTGKKLVICKVIKTDIKKIYISNCTLSNDIVMVDKDTDSKVIKFNYNECTFNSTGDFKISDIVKISLNNMTFNVKGKLEITCPNISMNDGDYTVGELKIDNKDEIISKIVMNKINLEAKTVNINNSLAETEDFIFYDNDCKIKADKYTLKGYKPSFTRTSFSCKDISIGSLTISTLTNVSINTDDIKETNLNILSSLAGSFNLLNNTSKSNKFNLSIKDPNLYMNINTFELHGTLICPEIHFSTNTPIKAELYNLDPEYVYFAYSEKIESLQKSKIIHKFNALTFDSSMQVINDSEKLCSISKSVNSDNDVIFEIDKKDE